MVITRPRITSVLSGFAMVIALLGVGARDACAQGQALSLTHGTNGHLEVAAGSNLTPAGGITVEAWVTYTPITSTAAGLYPTIIRKNPANSAEAYFLRVAGTTNLVWKVKLANGLSAQVATTGVFSAPTLTHVCGTYDGAFVKLYVNGVLIGQAAGTGPISDPTKGVFRIGKGDDAVVGGEVWNGTIDEVRVWPFARTQNEILSTMGLEFDMVDGPISTWHLDGTGADTTGTNHGTLIASTPFVPSMAPITPYFPGSVTPYGVGVSGCTGVPSIGLSTLPSIGNVDFAIVSTHGPAAGGAGYLALGFIASNPPYQISGIEVYVDIFNPSTLLLPVNTGLLGTSSFAIPIPYDTNIIGYSAYAQYAWLDGCAVGGVSASRALQITLQP